MGVDDRSDSNMPGPSARPPFLHPDWAAEFDPDTAAGDRPGRRPLLRRLAGRWRPMLALWILVSALAIGLIYSYVEPAYEARSLLRVEPASAMLLSPELHGRADLSEVRPYLRTQVQLIKSKRVLNAALAREGSSTRSMIASSKDPVALLQRGLRARIVDGAYLIEVSLGSRDPDEAAAIVNAVVEAYLGQQRDDRKAANRTLWKTLESERGELDGKIKQIQDQLTDLGVRGNANAEERAVLEPPGQEAGGPVTPSFVMVSPERYREATNKLFQADFELMDAQARLETARRPQTQAPAEKIRELEMSAEEARRRRASYSRYLNQLKVRPSPDGRGEIAASLLKQDLEYLRRLREVIESKLEQLDFETRQEGYRVTVQDKAVAPRAAARDSRPGLAAVTALVVGLLVLGLFLVREVAAPPGGGAEVASDGESPRRHGVLD